MPASAATATIANPKTTYALYSVGDWVDGGVEYVVLYGGEVSVGCIVVVIGPLVVEPSSPDINDQGISGGFTSGYLSRISLPVVVAIRYGTSTTPSLFASGPL